MTGTTSAGGLVWKVRCCCPWISHGNLSISNILWMTFLVYASYHAIHVFSRASFELYVSYIFAQLILILEARSRMLYSFSYWDRMTHLKITPYAIILLVSLYLNSVTSFLGLVTGCCISVLYKNVF